MKKCLSFLFRVEKHINMNYSIISDGIYTTHKKLRILNILNFFCVLDIRYTCTHRIYELHKKVKNI